MFSVFGKIITQGRRELTRGPWQSEGDLSRAPSVHIHVPRLSTLTELPSNMIMKTFVFTKNTR